MIPMEEITYRAMLSEAWRRTRRLLFQPFNLTTWLVLGFSAWLAGMGERGGSFNFNWPFTEQDIQPREVFDRAMEFISAHLVLITVSVGTVLIFVFIISILLLWLSSRGKCMFLENLITGRPTVQEAWRNQRERGHSLFLWRVMYMIVTGLVLLCIAAGGVFLILPCWLESALLPVPIAMLAILVFLLLVVLLLMAVITVFLEDFVIPIMLLRRETAVQAWHTFLTLLYGHAWSFTAYLFVKAGVTFLIGVVFLIFFLMTCCLFCVGGMLMVVPYLGTVLLLPYPVFLRYFSLAFLASLGPEWNLLPPPAPVDPVQTPQLPVA